MLSWQTELYGKIKHAQMFAVDIKVSDCVDTNLSPRMLTWGGSYVINKVAHSF